MCLEGLRVKVFWGDSRGSVSVNCKLLSFLFIIKLILLNNNLFVFKTGKKNFLSLYLLTAANLKSLWTVQKVTGKNYGCWDNILSSLI